MDMSLCRPADLNGVTLWHGLLDADDQAALLAEVRAVVAAAPLFRPVTPGGRPMSVRMTSAGRFGWISDRRGYRYAELHPAGMAWPPIPPTALAVWAAVAGAARAPDCCLVNFYGEGARMGLHQDRDEADFAQPVVSISLGDEGLFRVGEAGRPAQGPEGGPDGDGPDGGGPDGGGPDGGGRRGGRGRTASVWLRSGDVAVLAGPARLAWHGVDRIRFGSSPLLARGGRLNLTLRVAR